MVATAAALVVYAIATFVGGTFAGDGRPARSAQLGSPEGLAWDRLGNLYIADGLDDRVRRVGTDGRIATVAGTGMRGFSGDGGPAAEAELNQPYGLAFDAAGNLYVADLGNARVRRISPDGTIATVAGGGNIDSADAVPGASARLKQPRNLALAPDGSLYISDFADHRVYRLTEGGLLYRVAGTGAAGSLGPGAVAEARAAPLNAPAGLAADALGRLYIADSGNGVVRVVYGGWLSTLADSVRAGGRYLAVAVDAAATVYAADKFGGAVVRLGPSPVVVYGRPAVFEPRGIAFGPDGALYIADAVPGLRTAGVVRRGHAVFAGDGTYRPAGDGLQAWMAHVAEPGGVAVAPDGAVFLSDTAEGTVRRVVDGVISTVATGLDRPGPVAAAPDGAVWVAERNRVTRLGPGGFSVPAAAPAALAVDREGNVYVAERTGVKKLSPSGAVAEFTDVDRPSGLAVDEHGGLYVASPGAVRRDGRVAALMETPGALAIEPEGAVIAIDRSRHRVVRLGEDGAVKPIAGTGAAGFAGDGGPADAARLKDPAGLAFDRDGNLYIADRGNRRIRRLTPRKVVDPDPVEIFAAVNAASMQPGPLAPGELVTLFGAGIGPPAPVHGALELSLEGFEVLFDGEPAPLLYAQWSQVNLQAPYSIAGRATAEIEVRERGVRRFGLIAPVAAAAPGIFDVVLNQDGSENSAARPAPRGSVLVFWATGEGQTDPPGITGRRAGEPLPKPVLPVTVTIGGRPAAVDYAGAAPGFAGLMQVNVRVPTEAAPGAAALELSVGEARAGITIHIR